MDWQQPRNLDQIPPIMLGGTQVELVNGVLGDPLVHLRLTQQRRGLLFDLGDCQAMCPKDLHRISDVFVSHAHFDHFGGFLWFLRARLSKPDCCRIFGPPGMIERVRHMILGIHWDRIENYGPHFEVWELENEQLIGASIKVNAPLSVESLPVRTISNGLLLDEADFQVRAQVLDHGIPVLAFAYQEAARIKVDRTAIDAADLPSGPWLGELVNRAQAGELVGLAHLPQGTQAPWSDLAGRFLIKKPGEKLVYATDLADHPTNRRQLIAFAQHADLFICESAFTQADADQAKASGHLTTNACAALAAAAQVKLLIPFHFSKRYNPNPLAVMFELQAALGATKKTRALFPPSWQVSSLKV